MRRLACLLFIGLALFAQTSILAPWTISASSGAVVAVAASTNGFGTDIYHVSGSWNNASTVTLEYGTGTKCGSGTNILWGPSGSLVNIALDFAARPPHVPPGNDFCISFGSSVTGGGGTAYDQRR